MRSAESVLGRCLRGWYITLASKVKITGNFQPYQLQYRLLRLSGSVRALVQASGWSWVASAASDGKFWEERLTLVPKH